MEKMNLHVQMLGSLAILSGWRITLVLGADDGTMPGTMDPKGQSRLLQTRVVEPSNTVYGECPSEFVRGDLRSTIHQEVLRELRDLIPLEGKNNYYLPTCIS